MLSWSYSAYAEFINFLFLWFSCTKCYEMVTYTCWDNHGLVYFILVITVSEWLLLKTNLAIFQLYHGKNQLIFNEIMMMSGDCSFCSIVLVTHRILLLLDESGNDRIRVFNGDLHMRKETQSRQRERCIASIEGVS